MKISKYILSGLMIISLFLFPFASSDVNVDGGGGGYGSGNQQNRWFDHEGVRVSVYTKSGIKVAKSIEYSNNAPNVTRRYVPKSKLEYLKGASPTLMSKYKPPKPKIALPSIINKDMNGSGGIGRIEELKKHFAKVNVVQNIFDDMNLTEKYEWDTGVSEEERIKKFHASLENYKIVFEPVAYFKFHGEWWAMTATEAGLYPNQNALKAYLRSLTHKNLPLASFLERDDLGIGAYKGSKSGIQSKEDIVKFLGIGIVSFDNAPEIVPQVIEEDYTYHTDTWVITAFDFVADKEYNSDEPAEFSFTFPQASGISEAKASGVVVPAGETQRVWVKWKTPSTPTILNISVSGSGDTSGNIIARIIEDKEKTPPDPKPNDRYDRFKTDFSAVTDNRKVQKNHAAWSVYTCKWIEPTYKDDPSGEIDPNTGNVKQIEDDPGYYEFTNNAYSALLDATVNVIPSSLTPTAVGKKMKSGYGFESVIDVNLSGNGASDCTSIQKAKAWFPEFLYKNFNRILELDPSDNTKFIFAKNKFSQEFHIANNEKSRIHFTPVWYPDISYKVLFEVYDVWTPSGELRVNIDDTLEISGNMFQDWHIGPTDEDRN